VHEIVIGSIPAREGKMNEFVLVTREVNVSSMHMHTASTSL